MTLVVVKANMTVAGLKRGKTARLALTDQVQVLIDAHKLSVEAYLSDDGTVLDGPPVAATEPASSPVSESPPDTPAEDAPQETTTRSRRRRSSASSSDEDGDDSETGDDTEGG